MSQELDKFVKCVRPFFDAYKSFDLRILTFQRFGNWVNLVTQLIPLYEKASGRPWGTKAPITDNLALITGRWPICEFDPVIRRIAEGRYAVCDCEIGYGRVSAGEFQSTQRGFFQRTLSPDQAYREYGIHQTVLALCALDDSFQNLVQDIDMLDLALNRMNEPYADLFDLIHDQFRLAVKIGRRELSSVDVIAVPPVSLGSGTSIEDTRLMIGIDVFGETVMNDVSIGIIARRAGARANRVTYRLDQLDIHMDQTSVEHWAFSMPIQEASRVDLFLRYKNEVADQRSLENPRLAPSLLEIYNQMDDGGEILERFLKGEGTDKARDFELAVAFLFSLNGFACMPYSHMKVGNQEKRPDGIAVAPSTQTAVVYECTTSLATQENKLAKLLERVNKLQSAVRGFEFVPALIVSMPREAVSQSTFGEAKQDGICVLTVEDLTEFLDRCRKSTKPDEILAYIQSRL
ncbi:MAG: hypothetical protein AB1644_09745 [Candidatus Zixiibacteriota bacterium]